MKKNIRPHVILCTAGRLFTLIMTVAPLFMLAMFAKFAFFSGRVDYAFIPLVIFALALCFLVIWIMRFLWQQIWGKLILEDDKLTWKCLFCPRVQIKYSDIKSVTVRNFGSRNAVKTDMYKTGFQFIIITSGPSPSQPVDKMRCGRGLIKWAKTAAVCDALRRVLPEKFQGGLK